MAKILMSLCLLLSVSALAGTKPKTAESKKSRKPNAETRVLTGKNAQNLFSIIQGQQEPECGAGKCWVGARVVCQQPTSPAEGSLADCEITPLD